MLDGVLPREPWARGGGKTLHTDFFCVQGLHVLASTPPPLLQSTSNLPLGSSWVAVLFAIVCDDAYASLASATLTSVSDSVRPEPKSSNRALALKSVQK
jgi:hypothetical protein